MLMFPLNIKSDKLIMFFSIRSLPFIILLMCKLMWFDDWGVSVSVNLPSVDFQGDSTLSILFPSLLFRHLFLWFFYEFRDIFDLISNSSRRGSKAWIIYSISNVLESVTPLTVVKFTHSNVSYSYIVLSSSHFPLENSTEWKSEKRCLLCFSIPFRSSSS